MLLAPTLTELQQGGEQDSDGIFNWIVSAHSIPRRLHFIWLETMHVELHTSRLRAQQLLIQWLHKPVACASPHATWPCSGDLRVLFIDNMACPHAGNHATLAGDDWAPPEHSAATAIASHFGLSLAKSLIHTEPKRRDRTHAVR